MFKIAFVILAVCTVTCPAVCQIPGNNLVSHQTTRELNIFNNQTEKDLFARLLKGEGIDYLTLFSLSNSSDPLPINSVRSKIEQFISGSGLSTKTSWSKKDLKQVYAEIHNGFLNKYVDNPAFNRMFVNGDYNCATATALYALLLDTLSIDYVIHEAPQHVFLVAAPKSHNIVFETTTPNASFLSLDEKAKTQFLEYLYKNKIISKEEWISGDKEQLVNKYFFKDETINKRQLAGLLYYNAGINAIDKEDHPAAYKSLQKAYLLYPNEKLKFMLIVAIINLISQKNMEANTEAYPYYLRLCELTEQEFSGPLLAEYFKIIRQKYLFTSPDPKQYWSVAGQIIASVKDSSLQNELRHDHHYDLAHYHSIKNNHDSSLVYLDSIYAGNKENLLIQELISNTLLDLIRGMSNDGKVIIFLQDVFKKYPFIDSKSKLGDIYAFFLAKATAIAFQKDDPKEGNKYMPLIKEIIEKQSDAAKKFEVYFTNAFFEVYAYYMQERQYNIAKEFINSVIKYYPDNKELQDRVKFAGKVQ